MSIETIREFAINDFKKLFENDLISVKIEEGIYNYTIERLDCLGYAGQEEFPDHDFKMIYKQNLVKILMNLKFNKNKESLVEKVKTGKLLPETLAKLHREDLYPEKWDHLFKIRGSSLIKKKKGAHRCPKCKSWYTDYIEMQTRSADEAATVKVSCECGYHWRLG